MSAGDLADPTLVQEPKSCQTDNSCMDGLVCDPAVNVCVAPEPADMEISIRLVPPAEGSDMVEEQYAIGCHIGFLPVHPSRPGFRREARTRLRGPGR